MSTPRAMPCCATTGAIVGPTSGSRRDHPECLAFVAEADGAIVGTGDRDGQRRGRLDRDDLGGSGVASTRARDGLDRGDDRRGGGGRLPDARAGRHRCGPADVPADRVRGPDRVPDPRGARARRGRRRSRIRAFRRDDLDAMAAMDRAATGEDRTPPPARLRGAGHGPLRRSAPTARSAASSSGRRGAAARRSRPIRTMRPRSCGLGGSRPDPTSESEPVCWPRTSRASGCSSPTAGPRRGRARG